MQNEKDEHQGRWVSRWASLTVLLSRGSWMESLEERRRLVHPTLDQNNTEIGFVHAMVREGQTSGATQEEPPHATEHTQEGKTLKKTEDGPTKEMSRQDASSNWANIAIRTFLRECARLPG